MSAEGTRSYRVLEALFCKRELAFFSEHMDLGGAAQHHLPQNRLSDAALAFRMWSRAGGLAF
eukprot:4741982-Alexandrium_andersonii.AAC.1